MPAFALGCGTLVKVGEDVDDDGAEIHGVDGDGGSGGGAITPTPDPHNAVALLRSQLPGVSTGTGNSSAQSGGGPVVNPNDLFVVVANNELTCAAPHGSYDCGNWNVAIVFPPEMQSPGVYDLDSQALINYSSYSASGPLRPEGDCSFGGGSFTQGTVEIVSVDATEVVVRFDGTDTSEFDVNGLHSAPRCP